MIFRHTRRRLVVPLAAALVLGLSLTAVVPAGATSCLPGTGTPGDPFLVDSQADLELVGSGTNGCATNLQYRQTADITLTGDWTPLTPSTAFSGVYDGGGHMISGLTVTGTTDYRGLFAKATTGAVFRDLTLENVSVSGWRMTGGLVGSIENATVTNIAVSGTVTGTGGQINGGIVGGIAGEASFTVFTRVRFEGSVTGPRTVGGLIGYMVQGSVTASYSTADVTISDVNAADPNLGGLIGAIASVTVTDVYARGDLTNLATAKNDVGGLIGDSSDFAPDNVIERAYATGAVPGTDPSIGGLAGGSTGDVHRDSFWDTVTSGQATSRAGTGKTTAELTTISTFNDTATVGLTTAWPIVEGWQPYVAGTRVWGICPRVNDGYPFLLWQYDNDPCTAPVVAASPTLGVTCAGGGDGTLPVGSPITCTLTGGPADFDILWRAAYNPTFAEGVVRTGTDGTGTLTLTLPAAAAGSPITVELVAWTAPIPVGTAAGTAAGSAASGPVPTAIPAGDGPGTRAPLGLITVLAITMLLMTALRRPTASGTSPRRSV